MIGRGRLLIICTVMLLSASGAFAASDSNIAQGWLDKMSHAIKSLNYEGVFVYIHGKQMETMSITHSNDNGTEKERLLSLAGAPREILRNDDRLVCILPDSKSVVVEKSRPKNYLPVGLQKVASDLKKYYRFNLAGEERMTGREAVVIDVRPRDPYRYGYELWIDKETGMLLKSDLVNEKGDSVEQVMFTQISFLPFIPEKNLEQTISTQGYKWFKQENQKKQEQKHKSKSLWSVIKLPSGYMMGMHNTHGLPTSRMPVEHLMFTDGISSVSVYIEEMDKDKPLMKGFSSIGAVNAYTTVNSNHYITVVGEVPRAAVKMIGDYVRYTPGN